MTEPEGASALSSSVNQPDTTQASHDDFRRVHDHSTMGVLALNADGTISYANAATLAYTGLQKEEILGRHLSGIYSVAPQNSGNEAKVLRMEEITDQEFVVNTRPGEERWVLASSKVYRDVNDQLQTYLFLRDISGLKKRERLFSYLNTAAEELAKARDTQSALDQIAKFIVPTFTSWFTIDLSKEGKLEQVLLKHDDPGKIVWAREYRKKYPPDPNGNTGSAVVLKTGKPGFVPIVTDEMIALVVPDPEQLKLVRQIGLRSVIIAPVYGKDAVIGVVNFISSNADRHFDETDLEFALNFSNLIGLSLENARLNEAAANEISLRKQSEEQFRFLTDAIPHKMWTSGPDGRATYYNQRWHDYTGISGFDALREKIWNILHPDDRAKAAVEWPAAIQQGLETETEQRLLRYDGVYRWHLSRFTAHKNDEGQVILWVGTSTDIHEQKEAQIEIEATNDNLSSANEEMTAVNEELSSANEELAAVNEELASTNEELTETQASLGKTIEKLAASESRFRFLFNAIPQQVWTASPDGALNYVNDVVCRNFGYSTEEIVGHGWQKFIHPDDLTNCLEKWTASLKAGKEYLVEFRLLFHDQSYRWHLARAIPLVEDGVIQLWVGTNTNIELQKANEQKKDEFLSIASHELKTPLTNIKAFNQLQQRVKDPEKLVSFISRSSEHINRLERLINDLLDVTKITAGKMSYRMELFDFGKMMSETIDNARLIEQGHEIILENEANIEYMGDRYRLEQVINNFISNAVKYSPEGKKIIVRTKAEGENIVVSVQDFGIGIAPENAGQLFDRYYRVDNTAMRFEGLGLGLFISSEILNRHNGSFWIKSELGKGATFFFRLPVTENGKPNG
jgi:PAS domain S-box-containing protein